MWRKTKATQPTPNFRTPCEQLCKEEQNKLNSGGCVGRLQEHFQDLSIDEIVWESEQLAKSHGIYLEFNRDRTGSEKEWLYMLRFSIPGGGPLNREQWRIFDEVSEKHTTNQDGKPSLRLTTRQNIQFHWVRKKSIREIIQRVAESRFYTLNARRQYAERRVALWRVSPVFNGNELAEFGRYLPAIGVPAISASTHPDRTPTNTRYGPLLNRS